MGIEKRKMEGREFIESWNCISKKIHMWAAEKGFWDNPRNFGEMIALAHSELSEALEARRTGNQQSKIIPPFSQIEEELADTVIRLMDMGWALGFDVASAILKKMEYNADRPYRHGKEF